MDMDILEKAFCMLKKHALCDHCLGRQFAMLGYGLENDERGRAIKTVLLFDAHKQALNNGGDGTKRLKLLATNGFSETAKQVLRKAGKRTFKRDIPKKCFLCEGKFAGTQTLAEKAASLLGKYEYSTFLVGVELPVIVAEREDEFKAECDVMHGENMRNEFGRLIGKAVSELTGKEAEFRKPEIVVLVDPFLDRVCLQVNPLFVAGRYRKLVRDIPQSKWFCSNCRGKGCTECDWTGKLYPESVEEIVEKPFLDATGGLKGSFHASGREDIDARMLGNGRPFIVEIAKPKKRFLNLAELLETINVLGRNKVEVSDLRFADRESIRALKKGEHRQKEYLVTIEFENIVTAGDLRLIKEKLTNTQISQKTPTRVMHRRADLTREKYIYDVKVKRLSPHRAEMKIRCAGGLYVKELVSGDEGRTTPSVTEILNNKAKPMKLDVLNVIMEDRDEVDR